MSSRILRSATRTAAANAKTGNQSHTTPVKRQTTDSSDDANSRPKKAKPAKQTVTDSEQLSDPKPGPSSREDGGNNSLNGVQDQGHGQVLPVGKATRKTMHNELVLEAIAKELPADDLSSLRGTCVLWARLFSPKLAAAHKPIDLHNDRNRLRTGTAFQPPMGGSMISEFTDAIQPVWQSTATTRVPVGLGGFVIHDLGASLQRHVNSFLGICGQNITRLSLDLGFLKYTTVECVRPIVFEWTPELRELTLCLDRNAGDGQPKPARSKSVEPLKKQIPKLRKLTVVAQELGGRNSPFSLLLRDLFQCAVGLEHLSLNGYGRYWGSADVLHIIVGDYDDKVLSRFPALGQLKCLQVPRLTALDLELLIKLSTPTLQEGSRNLLRLVKLGTSLVCNHGGDESVAQGASDSEMISLTHRLLTTQSSTLRRLAIDMDGLNIDDDTGEINRYVISLPKMDHLHSMIVSRTTQWEFVVQCDNTAGGGTFAENFPELKRLEIQYDSLASLFPVEDLTMARVPISQFAHEGVTALKVGLYLDDEEEGPEALPLSRLLHTWPSISKLQLELDPSKFVNLTSFWNLWPGLVSLHVGLLDGKFGEKITVNLDEILSGIPLPVSKLSAIRRLIGSMFMVPLTKDHLRTLRNQFKTRPGISDLEQLQEFILDVGEHSFNITDVGGYLGLAMMSGPAVQHVALIQEDQDEAPTSDGKIRRKAFKLKGNRISQECRRFIRSIFSPYAVLDF